MAIERCYTEQTQKSIRKSIMKAIPRRKPYTVAQSSSFHKTTYKILLDEDQIAEMDNVTKELMEGIANLLNGAYTIGFVDGGNSIPEDDIADMVDDLYAEQEKERDAIEVPEEVEAPGFDITTESFEPHKLTAKDLSKNDLNS